MSFGTGHHATTYLMLQQMRQLNFEAKAVLDFGTGTGILSIMAKKLGAEKITAIDNDEWSIANAAENIAENECKSIQVKLADKPESGQYDVILANINKNIITEHLGELAVATKGNGVVLISGLLEEDEAEMLDALNAHYFQLKNLLKRNGWLCMRLSKTA